MKELPERQAVPLRGAYTANQLAQRCAKAETTVDALRESLGHALAQWRMYAETQEDRDLRTEQTAEGKLWREMKVEAGEILLVPPRHLSVTNKF